MFYLSLGFGVHFSSLNVDTIKQSWVYHALKKPQANGWVKLPDVASDPFSNTTTKHFACFRYDSFYLRKVNQVEFWLKLRMIGQQVARVMLKN